MLRAVRLQGLPLTWPPLLAVPDLLSLTGSPGGPSPQVRQQTRSFLLTPGPFTPPLAGVCCANPSPTFRFLFGDPPHAPLYRWGMRYKVERTGLLFRAQYQAAAWGSS